METSVIEWNVVSIGKLALLKNAVIGYEKKIARLNKKINALAPSHDKDRNSFDANNVVKYEKIIERYKGELKLVRDDIKKNEIEKNTLEKKHQKMVETKRIVLSFLLNKKKMAILLSVILLFAFKNQLINGYQGISTNLLHKSISSKNVDLIKTYNLISDGIKKQEGGPIAIEIGVRSEMIGIEISKNVNGQIIIEYDGQSVYINNDQIYIYDSDENPQYPSEEQLDMIDKVILYFSDTGILVDEFEITDSEY